MEIFVLAFASMALFKALSATSGESA